MVTCLVKIDLAQWRSEQMRYSVLLMRDICLLLGCSGSGSHGNAVGEASTSGNSPVLAMVALEYA